jgi:hypothetical protein
VRRPSGLRRRVRCRRGAAARTADGKYPALFDTVLNDADIKIVLSGIQMLLHIRRHDRLGGIIHECQHAA